MLKGVTVCITAGDGCKEKKNKLILAFEQSC